MNCCEFNMGALIFAYLFIISIINYINSKLYHMDSECKEGLVKVKVECKRNYKTKINIDCIKVCPMNKSVWAISFYQQQP